MTVVTRTRQLEVISTRVGMGFYGWFRTLLASKKHAPPLKERTHYGTV